jgi:hypothetical protein
MRKRRVKGKMKPRALKRLNQRMCQRLNRSEGVVDVYNLYSDTQLMDVFEFLQRLKQMYALISSEDGYLTAITSDS